MSSNFGLASPRRTPRNHADPASPAAASPHVPIALRFRPTSSPPRPAPIPLLQTFSQNRQIPHGADYPRGAAVRPSASSYSASRQDQRQDDEDHSSLQVILLLSLSVVLLTLPWVVDHPVTLLIPVALLVLPITSGALRSLVGEGFSLLVSGARWFWRHRTPAHQAPVRSPRPQPAAPSAQHGFHPSHTAAPWQQQTMNPQQPAAAYVSREPWHASPSLPPQRPTQPHTAARLDHFQRPPAAAPAAARAASPGARDPRLEWASRQQAPLRVAVPLAPQILGPYCRLPLPGPELDTPDLDFESDSDMEVLGDRGLSYSSYSQHQAPAAKFRQPHAPHAECTVHNWDEPTECTHRKGPKYLADLLSNGV